MKGVLILTEGGTRLGYGHLMRCLAIAQGFKAAGIDSVFYIRGDAEPEKILNEFQWKCIEWLDETPDVNGRIIILDSYYADEAFCKIIYDKAAQVLFIDDYNRIAYPGGFVLNSVIGAEEMGYPDNDSITYLLGPEYHPLRREFWDVPEKVINREIEKILITFGGTDMTNETPGILRFLKDNYPDLEKHVIIGKGFSNFEEIKEAADDKTVLIMHADAEVMKNEMLECDIAISAAGQTIYELARVGIPSIIKQIADNQENNIKNWERSGCFTTLSSMTDIGLLVNLSYLVRCKNKLEMNMIVDGKGIIRTLEYLNGNNFNSNN